MPTMYSLRSYMKEDGNHDLDGATNFVSGLDDAGKDNLCKYMKDEAEDDEREFYEKVAPGKDVADPDADGIKSGEAKVSDKKPMKNQRDGEAEKYQRQTIELRGLKQRYSKLEAENVQLKKDLAEARGAEQKAIRYSKLSELKDQGYVFELEDELAHCESFSDDQFEKHTSRS